MFRRHLPRLASFLASLLLPSSVLAHEPQPAGGWPWDPDVTNVPASDRYPRPPSRIGNQRHLIAPEAQGGWRTYLGDLHAHSRGHGASGQATPNIQRDEVNLSAWYFGYDFIAITNHSTSWKLYDELAPLHRFLSSANSLQPPDLLALKGVESYAGPQNLTHFSAFNQLILLDTDSLSVWHSALIARYAEDPTRSTHVQLNHPNQDDPWFSLPSEPDRRRKVREVVELAEYNGMPSYFELLRRGFRVAPVSNTDSHASFALPQEPGVPPEKWKGEERGGRAGILLPASEPFTYESFLWALRERRAFHTTVPAASGFFVVNQHPMGSEFTLAPGEERLDFTVWGTTREGRAGRDAWKRLEVWSPFQPDRPLVVFEYADEKRVDLKQTLSLTPYESIYVLRLQQGQPDAEVLLAPIWITNPVARPHVSLSRSGLSGEDTPCLVVQGGGEVLHLQRADTEDEDARPGDWRTVATVSPGGGCHALDTADPRGRSRWRVVDAFQAEVVSNEVALPPR
ncbi:hypothetical protein [Melittangium boletus]|uniref:HIN-200 domain-containing protein n=1 Tax=Melittangium boletus DSM 14713 TaxID=1294270 RepID=A0A250INT8_9BACT|nr:hypothetical protein [Melittangium boletus]ATB32892.1 hypothetical protein MEBOL_006381 [Melittangium boletus DSM 14713]